MYKIKFNKKYKKLNNIDTEFPVTLLNVFNQRGLNMSKAFLHYDTSLVIGEHNQLEILENQNYLVLLFKDCKDQIFTTIRKRYESERKYSPHPWDNPEIDKFEYYWNLRGKLFEVVIENE